jgi:uncharacterized protein (TIGR02598 family)
MKSAGSSRKAFTLVEVVLGLGVISFCLTILMGLFATGLVNSKRSRDDTHLSALSWSVANELRATNAYYMASSLAPAPMTPYTNYYDAAGQPTNQTSAYYACKVELSPTPQASPLPSNLQVVQLIFTYPTGAPAPHTNIAYVFLPPS